MLWGVGKGEAKCVEVWESVLVCGEDEERCGDVEKCWLLGKVWESVLECGGDVGKRWERCEKVFWRVGKMWGKCWRRSVEVFHASLHTTHISFHFPFTSSHSNVKFNTICGEPQMIVIVMSLR